MRYEDTDATWLDHRTKGMPGGMAPMRLDAIGAQGWNLLREDLPLPLAVLKESALAHNGRWMRDFLTRSGAVIAPHGKTTMSPDLFGRQLDDGAWAITLATVNQVQVARDFGFSRIILANQLIGRQALRYVLDELRRDPQFEFFCLVDSSAGVAQIGDAVRGANIGRPLQVLLEGGFAGGRTGCRTEEDGLRVARAVKAASPYLALRGVEGFEGMLHRDDPTESEAAVSMFLNFLVSLARQCERDALFAEGEIILSAGGSRYYDMVVQRFGRAGLRTPVRVVTRSGCYLAHDSIMYHEAFQELLARSPDAALARPGLRPALEVWAYVQSRPEPSKVVLTMGKRDISWDDPPVALKWFRPGDTEPNGMGGGHIVTNLNDQHCHMAVPSDSPLAVG
ncbi:MAG: amino acid deaminase, partial [Chloroflexota bacterium]